MAHTANPEKVSSKRPYLIRALYEWLIDNGLTPHLWVNVGQDDRVQVPMEFVKEGRIVLNIGLSAVRSLELGNDLISFNARFGGKPMDVFIPPSAVLGIYAKENGEGMRFPDEKAPDTDNDPPPTTPTDRPSLKIVK